MDVSRTAGGSNTGFADKGGCGGVPPIETRLTFMFCNKCNKQVSIEQVYTTINQNRKCPKCGADLVLESTMGEPVPKKNPEGIIWPIQEP